MGKRPASNRLAFYLTPPHGCGYLPERLATTLFADPTHPMDRRLYSVLSQSGFRRSGGHVYRPHCVDCRACVPVRVPVRRFQPRRSQRRTWRSNRDLRVRRRALAFDPEHFALYRRYLERRHPGGGMDKTSPGQYVEFLNAPWADTLSYEFRAGTELLAIAVVDVLVNGLSAVYTFFDPDCERRSLGTYAILWQIAEARRLGLDWLYLGYWIEESPKMRYKRDYQPQEHFRNGEWVPDGDPDARNTDRARGRRRRD